MTVDHHSQKENIIHSPLFQTLTLVFAGMTLLFALFSIITSNRLSTLRVDRLAVMEKSSSLETGSIAEMQTALKNAQTDLEAAKQKAIEEKKNAKQLTQKLATTQKELKRIKADLDAANQTIATYKTTQPTKPANTADTPKSNILPDSDTELSTQPLTHQKEMPAQQETLPTPDQPAIQAPTDQPSVHAPPEKPSSQSIAPVIEKDSAASPPPISEDQKTVQVVSTTSDTTLTDTTSPSPPQSQKEE